MPSARFPARRAHGSRSDFFPHVVDQLLGKIRRVVVSKNIGDVIADNRREPPRLLARFSKVVRDIRRGRAVDHYRFRVLPPFLAPSRTNCMPHSIRNGSAIWKITPSATRPARRSALGPIRDVHAGPAAGPGHCASAPSSVVNFSPRPTLWIVLTASRESARFDGRRLITRTELSPRPIPQITLPPDLVEGREGAAHNHRIPRHRVRHTRAPLKAVVFGLADEPAH